MGELPPPQGEMEVCVLSNGHFTDILIWCFYLFFYAPSPRSVPYLRLYALFTRTYRVPRVGRTQLRVFLHLQQCR